MRILVTGGAGFIGANLCRELTTHPDVDAVIAFDNLSTGLVANLEGSNASFIRGDILDLDALRTAMKGCDSVVHLAARPSVPRSIADPLASHHANVTGTVHVLEAARHERVSHVIAASSSSVYGANDAMPKSETLVPSPVSPYAASKLATEAYSSAYARSFGFDVLVFRFFNVFGPLQAAGHPYAAVVPSFVDAALRGMPLPVHGDGRQSRDFTFVGSVCAVITDAVRRRVVDAGPVNLAFGSRVALLDVILLLEDILGRRLARTHLPSRPGDVRHSEADDARLRALFPAIEAVPLRRGLEQTIAWFMSLDVSDRLGRQGILSQDP